MLDNLDNLTVEQVLEIVDLLENTNESNYLKVILEVGRRLGYKLDTAKEFNEFLSNFLALINSYPLIFMNSQKVVNYLINIMKYHKEFLAVMPQ